MAASPFLMQYMRDTDPVGAIFAGAQNRPAEELVTALRKGNYLRKFGRRGKPKTHYFRLSRDDKELVWDSSNGKTRSIPLASVVRVQQGQTTEVFLRDPLPEYEALSFSLIYTEGKTDKKHRSLDVICKNVPEFETWYWGIQLVIAWAQHLELQQDMALLAAQEAAFAVQKEQALSSSIKVSAPHVELDKLQEFKQIAAALQPTPAPSITAKIPPVLQQVPGVKTAGVPAGPTRQRLSGLLGLPEKREIGDCFIWGDWGDLEWFASLPTAENGALQSCCLPMMVSNTHALDIIQVAVGARHAALLTRGGEVYTWGSGQGGKLGNGSTYGSFYPYQVTRLSGKGTVSVACGRTYTAAVLGDGSLYTWGTGAGGQLGLGPTVSSAVWPMRVAAALDTVRVDKVSCGPFHAAAISNDGRLFTWGDGMFGKLGHGGHESSSSPQAVSALADYWVLSVSCGWWHSAAAAAPRSSRPGHSNQSSADMSESNLAASNSDPGTGRESGNRVSGRGVQVRGNYKQMRSSSLGAGRAAAAASSETGGWLFTWGGDFTWQQRGKRDHHEGCLGLGDLNGRLVPTMVKGEDDIKQVACGLNFTVALTGNGEVLQMGSTGAENSREHNAMWEGARVPVLVSGQMSTHFAEGVACGMSHIAVVATQRGKNTSAAANGGQVTRLLTWGQGSRGQLGLGDARDDHLLPQVVTAVAGRKILYLACGGNYTLAVCEHDPRLARCSRDSQDIDMLTSPAVSSNNLISLSTVSKLAISAAATATAVGAGAGAGYGASGSERAAANAAAARLGTVGSGGLVMSGSVNSLASSVPSSSRGDGGSGGGTDVSRNTMGVRKSDRGKLESRYSERGLIHQSLSLSPGMLSQASRDRNNSLSRSLDRSLGGLVGVAAAAVGNGDGGRGVSFATNPATVPSADRRSDKSGGSSVRDSSRDKGDVDHSLMSFQALAGSGKKSRLAFTKSLKNMVANGSNNSSSNSSRHGWGGLSQQQLVKGGFRQGQGSSNVTNSSARSETDLMTISTNSSLSSMTPAASNNSMMDGRQLAAAAAAGDVGSVASSDAAALEIARQLRYWQERAANMEQQLTRKTHELEQLRKEMGGSEQVTAQQQQQPPPPPPPQQQRRRSSSGVTRQSESGENQPVQSTAVEQPNSDWRLSEAASIATAASTAADQMTAGDGAAQQKHQVESTAAAAAAGHDEPVVSEQLQRDASLVAWAKPGRGNSVSNSRTASTSNSGTQPTAAAAAEGGGVRVQRKPSLAGRRGSSDQFRLDNLNPAAPTGLEVLRETMGSGSSSQSSASAPAAGSSTTTAAIDASSSSSSGYRHTSSLALSGRPGDVLLQDSAFQEMGAHSNEASRVLALFQESHRHRQELEEQQQQQQQEGDMQVPAASVAAVGAAHPLDVDETDELATSNSSLGYVGANSGIPPVSTAAASSGGTSVNGRQQQQQQQQQVMGSKVQQQGNTTAATQQPGTASVAESVVAAELQQLREQNRLLQQQLHGAVVTSREHHQQHSHQHHQHHHHHQQQQQQQQFLPPVAAVQQLSSSPPLLRCGSGAVPVISLTPGSAAAGPLGGHRHRRTVSVDISSSAAGHLTHEVAPGIFLSLQALESGVGYELKRVRFAKQVYSASDADSWWAANKAAIYAAYCIVEPPLDEQQQRRQSAAVSSTNSSSRGGAMSVLNALGTSNAAAVKSARGAAAAAAVSEGHGRRVSSGVGDALPSSPVHSPTFSITGNCSTYELDLFRPSAAQTAAAGGGAGSSSSIPGEGLSRLGRSESVTAAAAATGGSSSGPNSPSGQANKRAGSIGRASTIGAAGMAAAEQLVSGMQGQNGNIVSMVRSKSQQPGIQDNAAAAASPQQQRLVGQEETALLSPRYVEEWQLARFNRYSQASSESGSVIHSGVNSSSGGGEHKRGGSAAGGIFRLFSRSGDSAGT